VSVVLLICFGVIADVALGGNGDEGLYLHVRPLHISARLNRKLCEKEMAWSLDWHPSIDCPFPSNVPSQSMN
jgi:hypothetical protein